MWHRSTLLWTLLEPSTWNTQERGEAAYDSLEVPVQRVDLSSSGTTPLRSGRGQLRPIPVVRPEATRASAFRESVHGSANCRARPAIVSASLGCASSACSWLQSGRFSVRLRTRIWGGIFRSSQVPLGYLLAIASSESACRHARADRLGNSRAPDRCSRNEVPFKRRSSETFSGVFALPIPPG